MKKCKKCGKGIDTWDSYGCLITPDEDDYVGRSEYLGVLCEECWDKLMKEMD